MSRQDQTAHEGAEAYQAGGDLVVNRGLSSDELATLLVAMGRELKVHFDEAERKVEERLAQFREAVITEFSENASSKTEAFSDPDFQFITARAQEAYVRSGSGRLKDDLVQLLGKRSSSPAGSRLAKVLNQAIETAGNLSEQELAILAISFALQNVRFGGPTTGILIKHFGAGVYPFLDDLTDNQNAYEYLEAQRCGSVNHIITRSLSGVLHQSYASRMSGGFPFNDMLSAINGANRAEFNGLFVIMDESSQPRLRFDHQTIEALQMDLDSRGCSPDVKTNLVNLYAQSQPDENTVFSQFQHALPWLPAFEKTWSSSHLHRFTLTAVGKAIGHSLLQSRVNLNAPIEIWIN